MTLPSASLVLLVAIFAPLRPILASDLEDRREELLRQIEATRERLQPLSDPWLRCESVGIELSAAPIISLATELNALPPALRRTHISVYDHSGQLAGRDDDCDVGDSTGWFIEFDNPAHRAHVDVTLGDLRAAWVPNEGLQVRLRANLSGEVGMLHWHWDPDCFGGGAGGKAGPANCSGSAELSAMLRLGHLVDGSISYALRASMSSLPIDCQISAGDLGDVEYNVSDAAPRADIALDGRFDLPLSLEGDLTLPLPGAPVRKHFALRLLNADVGPTAAGVTAKAGISLLWSTP